MSHHAVFFDRDNTLNYDPGYLDNPDKVKLFPGVPDGIARLRNEFGFKIIVVSNQSGITRGFFSHETVRTIHKRLNELLEVYNTRIDAFYYCPYHPEFDPPEKTICRKPSPYMVVKAADDLKIDLSRSYLVGDKPSDIICAYNAGVKSILVNYNNNEEPIIVLKKDGKTPNFIASNFLDVCDFIISDIHGE